MMITNEQKYEILKLRSQEVPYSKIGAMFNISNKRVSDVATKVRSAFKGGNVYYASAIANAAKVTVNEVIQLAKYHIREDKKTTPRQFKIKINDIVSNKNIWYAHRKGEVFEAKRSYGYHIVNNNILFKVKERDCTEVPPIKQSA